MSPLAFATLRLIADGRFHSGADLVERLNLSRASVWAAVREVQAQRIAIHAVRGRGYRLAEPLELIDAARVNTALAARGAPVQLSVLEVADSTNSYLLAGPDLPSGSCVLAELQTAGRGRQGRAWYSGLGGALTFSIKWRFAGGAASLSGLSLAVGVAVARALEGLGIGELRLKWPNDLLARGGKLGGILIEAQGDLLGPSLAVIGIGINFRLPAEVRARIDQPVTDLASLSATPPSRNAVLTELLANLAAMLQTFAEQGFAPFRADWQARDAHAGKRVRLVNAGGPMVSGRAVGVAEDGALLLEADGCVTAHRIGELSFGPVRGARTRAP